MNLHGKIFGRVLIFLGYEFATDDEAYNFYNTYSSNKGFGARKKVIDKSQRPLHEVICRKYCCNKEGVERLEIKDKKGLHLPLY